MSVETLALNSIISEQISLDSGITAFDENSLYGTFNGSSAYVSVADSSLLSFGDGSNDSAFSFSLWVYFDSTGSTQSIITKGNYFTDAEYWIYRPNNGNINFRIYDNSTGDSFLGKYISGGAPLNQWIHFTVTYDGSSLEGGIKIYKNGVIGTMASSSGGSNYTAMENLAAPLQIGYHTDSSIYISGKMRDVKIFDVELTAAQVLTEYGANNRTDDLIAHYKLYTDVDDSGGNGLDGVNTDVTFPVSRSLLEITSGVETTLALNSSLL